MINVIDKIVAEAKREDEELKRNKRFRNLEKKIDWVGKGIIENTLTHPYARSCIVDITEKPVSAQNFISFDPNVRATTGVYTIQYVPKTDKLHVRGKPFVIGQDLVRLRVTVSSPAHWHHLAERIPELGWIDRNSTLTNSMFAVAKMHPGIPFHFTIDWVNYSDKMMKLAKEQGIDIDNKPFVAYQCSFKTYEAVFKEKQLSQVRTDLDYADTIWEIDKKFEKALSVQNKKGDK